MIGTSSSEFHIASVEIICAEHLQRTLLECDEATDFQRIISLAVSIHHGKWSFQQYYPFQNSSRMNYSFQNNIHETDIMTRGNNPEELKEFYPVLARREEFMKNEGRLLYRMKIASKGIRRSL